MSVAEDLIKKQMSINLNRAYPINKEINGAYPLTKIAMKGSGLTGGCIGCCKGGSCCSSCAKGLPCKGKGLSGGGGRKKVNKDIEDYLGHLRSGASPKSFKPKSSKPKSSKPKSKPKGKRTDWISHVKNVWSEGKKKNPNYSYKQALQDAKAYRKC